MPKETEKLAYSVYDAALLLGISKTKTYSLLESQSIRPFKVGSRTLISRSELERFVDEAQEVRK